MLKEIDLAKYYKPDVVMFFAPSCPHCPAMMANLTSLLKNGMLASLNILNIELHAQGANELGVRSLPWVKIGNYELDGLRTTSELEKWAKSGNTIEGASDYLAMLLKSGKLQQATQYLEVEPHGLASLVALLEDIEQDISVRTGISALLEGLEGSDKLANSVELLSSLLSSKMANIRADACFFLGLTHNPGASRFLDPMLKDTDKHVREIAEESLEKLETCKQT